MFRLLCKNCLNILGSTASHRRFFLSAQPSEWQRPLLLHFAQEFTSVPAYFLPKYVRMSKKQTAATMPTITYTSIPSAPSEAVATEYKEAAEAFRHRFAYFTLLPLTIPGASAKTKLPCPSEAARSIPLDSIPNNVAGARLAITITFLPTNCSGS